MVKEQGKEAGGPWDCYQANNFYGWEAERVVAVTDGLGIMELITRAKTHLSVIFVKDNFDLKNKGYFQQAADLGRVEMVQLSGEAVGISQNDDEANVVEEEEEIANETVEDVEDVMEEKIYCLRGCCTS